MGYRLGSEVRVSGRGELGGYSPLAPEHLIHARACAGAPQT